MAELVDWYTVTRRTQFFPCQRKQHILAPSSAGLKDGEALPQPHLYMLNLAGLNFQVLATLGTGSFQLGWLLWYV